MRIPWIKNIKDAYHNAKRPIAYFCVLAISASPLIQGYLYYKIIAQSVLLGILVSIILDLFKQTEVKFDTINSKLGIKEPPTFEGFSNALPHIRQSIVDEILNNRDVNITVLSISGQFTWKNIVEVLLPEMLKYNNNRLNFSVEFAVVKPDLLTNWGQKKLTLDCNRTIDGFPITIDEEVIKNHIDNGRLTLGLFEYDNIPHWHGVLINQKTLFLGRCKWDMGKQKKELLVGRKEYRLFTTSDRFQGLRRIQLFSNWFEAYKFRSSKNGGNKQHQLTG